MSKNTDPAPVEKVVSFIKKGIEDHIFSPGDRLPSERKLAESLCVSRPHVRRAFQKLETYGIVQTFPQSGTVVSPFNKDQLDGLVQDALKEEKYDFFSLVYVRVLLEIEACKLAAVYRTDEDIARAEAALRDLELCKDPDDRVQKDFSFHHAIAECSHNPVIVSLLLIITPDIMTYYHKYRFCSVPERIVSTEHREFIMNIKNGEVDSMRELVLRHLHNQIETAEALSGKEMPQFKPDATLHYNLH